MAKVYNYTKKTGRPTKMTDEVIDKIRQACAFGANDREASAYADISFQTLYKHIKRHPEFRIQMNEWRLNPFLKAKKTIVDNIQKDIGVAKWYLERKAKKEYGLNVDVTTDGEKLPTPILSGIIKEDDIRRDDSSTQTSEIEE